ncbi:MAG: heavy-metal-associated domain-containing protein [Cytophagales bacterium]|nr:heavy-metal-associated domain-containing protein [Cytophagales bacterium]
MIRKAGKKTSLYIILLLSLFSLCKAQTSEQDNFVLIVEGLGCNYCAIGLETRLNKLESRMEKKGAEGIEIDIETGEVSFSFPSIDRLSPREIYQIIEEANYTLAELNLTRSSGEKETWKKSEGPVPPPKTESDTADDPRSPSEDPKD